MGVVVVPIVEAVPALGGNADVGDCDVDVTRPVDALGEVGGLSDLELDRTCPAGCAWCGGLRSSLGTGFAALASSHSEDSGSCGSEQGALHEGPPIGYALLNIRRVRRSRRARHFQL